MTALQSRELLDALKRAAAALRGAQIPFAVGGGLAAWARGGPPTEHDIDLLIREDDARRALDACAAAGMRTEVPPEGWLVKAWDGEILVDLIFRPTGSIVDDGLFDRCEVLNVQAVRMSVLPVDDILATKLLALTEHNLDYGPVLEYARSLREQIDWETLRRRTDGSPFARAFFTLVEQLGVWHGDAARAAGAAEALHAADASAAEAADQPADG
ncbi:MAG TPA: nucleotidyltransferase [Acidimicrobiia bacterium]|nr:nucleotidyltransferase [Acidimicrobiia bacterium]